MELSLIWRRQWHPTPVLLPGKSYGQRSLEGCTPWGRWGSDTTERLHFTFHFHALEKEMATHSSVLAWRIPGTGEPGGLPSMGWHRVGHDWSNLAASLICILVISYIFTSRNGVFPAVISKQRMSQSSAIAISTEVHIKRTISVSQDSGIFPYIENP